MPARSPRFSVRTGTIQPSRLAILLLAAALTGCGSPADDRPLNVIILFADDLGYGDLGTYGHPTIRTPNLDRMAHEGQKWTSFYAQASVCSPSRAALLTGRLHLRSGMYGARRVLFPDSASGLPSDEITLAEALREQGYATAIVGKWHLGHLPPYLPTEHGFDSWYGIPYSNDMDWTLGPERELRRDAYYNPKVEYWNVPLMENDQIIERPAFQPTLTRRFTERATRFIRQNLDRPFFLYVPYTMPHMPLFRSEERAGKSDGGVYGDVVEEIDWSVGEILDTLHQEGLTQHTLVIFTSDNGPWTLFRTHGGSAGPLRDGKGTTWEGGMRVPGIFWGPGIVEPGVVAEIGSVTDLFPTVLKLSGGAPPQDRVMDGVDLSTLLRNTHGTAPAPRDVMFYYRTDELYAVRRGPYKAHFLTAGAYGQGSPYERHDPPLLYHLGRDPGERFDIARDHPEVLADLLQEAEDHRQILELAEPLFDR